MLKNKTMYFSKNNIYIYIYSWLIILLFWIGLIIFSYWINILLQWQYTSYTHSPIVCQIILVFNFLFVTALYCSSIKNFVFAIVYAIFYKNGKSKFAYTIIENKTKISINRNISPKVFVLYTTCNDFDSEALKKSLNQSYKNCKFFILDDSNEKYFIDKIDEFSSKFNVEVIRRKNRNGYKAGNINNFLKGREDYDYFVLMDSDEIIPLDYVSRTLPYFSKDNVGIVQCNNKCNRQDNLFDYFGSFIHNTQWNTEYVVRHSIGIVNCCGHGTIISKKMYNDAGGFPELILEDWALTLKGLKLGYETVYVHDIICWEEFPTNYLAFKKRNYRWTQGGVQCFSKIGWKIFFFNKCPFFRRLDILLTQTNYLITIGSLIIILATLSILSPLGFNFKYENWYIAISIFFALIPLLNCFIYYFGKINFFKLLFILLFFYLLYSSLFVSVLISIFENFIGKKLKFVVTPKKETKKITFLEAVRFNVVELIVGVILTTILIISLVFIPNVNFSTYLWIILIVIPMFLTIPLTLMSNIKLKNKKHELENVHVI